MCVSSFYAHLSRSKSIFVNILLYLVKPLLNAGPCCCAERLASVQSNRLKCQDKYVRHVAFHLA